MDQENSFNSSLQQMLNIEMSQLNELQQIKMGQKNTSNYPMYTDASMSMAQQSGNYAPPVSTQGVRMSPFGQQQMGSFNAERAGALGAMFIDRTRTPGVQSDLMAQQGGQHLLNAATAGVGAVGSTIGSLATMGWGGSAFSAGASSLGAGTIGAGAMGLVGGIFAGAVGGAAVEGGFKVAQQQVKVQQGYDNYLMANSYRYIDRNESNNTREGMGFSQSEQHSAANYLRTVNSGHGLEDSEVSSMLKGFTDQGLLKDVTGLKDFKDKFSKMIDIVKQSALIMNESYDNVVKMMGDMDKAGITTKNFDYISGKMKALGSFTGQTATEAYNQTVNTSQNQIQGSTVGLQNQIGVNSINTMETSAMWDSVKGSNTPLANYFANNGGAAGISQFKTQVDTNLLTNQTSVGLLAGAFTPGKNGTFSFNSNFANQEIGKTIDQMSNDSAVAMKGWTGEQSADFLNSASDLMRNLSPDQQRQLRNALLQTTKNKMANGNLKKASTISNSDAMTYASTIYGVTGEAKNTYAALTAYDQANGKNDENSLEGLTYQTMAVGALNANARTPIQAAKYGLEGLGDIFGNPFANISDKASDISTSISRMWSGQTGLENYKSQTKLDLSKGINSLYGGIDAAQSKALKNLLDHGDFNGMSMSLNGPANSTYGLLTSTLTKNKVEGLVDGKYSNHQASVFLDDMYKNETSSYNNFMSKADTTFGASAFYGSNKISISDQEKTKDIVDQVKAGKISSSIGIDQLKAISNMTTDKNVQAMIKAQIKETQAVGTANTQYDAIGLAQVGQSKKKATTLSTITAVDQIAALMDKGDKNSHMSSTISHTGYTSDTKSISGLNSNFGAGQFWSNPMNGITLGDINVDNANNYGQSAADQYIKALQGQFKYNGSNNWQSLASKIQNMGDGFSKNSQVEAILKQMASGGDSSDLRNKLVETLVSVSSQLNAGDTTKSPSTGTSQNTDKNIDEYKKVTDKFNKMILDEIDSQNRSILELKNK